MSCFSDIWFFSPQPVVFTNLKNDSCTRLKKTEEQICFRCVRHSSVFLFYVLYAAAFAGVGKKIGDENRLNGAICWKELFHPLLFCLLQLLIYSKCLSDAIFIIVTVSIKCSGSSTEETEIKSKDNTNNAITFLENIKAVFSPVHEQMMMIIWIMMVIHN